jgi:hypothetical protein
MIEKVDNNGYRVGNITLVDPVEDKNAPEFVQNFVLNNNCSRTVQTIMYDGNGKIVASHAA